jgi:ATP synthase I subunit
MSGEFVRRVSRVLLVSLGPVAVGGGLAAGWPGAVGGLAGGLISLGSFRWVASGVVRGSVPETGGRLAMSALGVGLRHLALFGTVAIVLGTGIAHPLALVAGLSVLPPVLIALGFWQTRAMQ